TLCPYTTLFRSRKWLAGFALGRIKNCCQITIATVRSRVGTVIASEHIGRKRAHLLSPATALAGFVLPRVKVKQIVVGSGHDRLHSICSGGFAGPVAAGE